MCHPAIHRQGQYDRALEYHAKDLAITLAVHGDQHPSTATTYNNMASVYDRSVHTESVQSSCRW